MRLFVLSLGGLALVSGAACSASDESDEPSSSADDELRRKKDAGAGDSSTTTDSSTPTSDAGVVSDAATPPPPTGSYISDYYAKWANGISSSPATFPIGVWMQDPTRQRNGLPNAQNYKNIGINTFVGLWDWPYDRVMYPGHSIDVGNALKAAGMFALAGGDQAASQWNTTNAGLATQIRGFQNGDEQDMNQVNYGPNSELSPLSTEASSDALRALDPTRPVHINYGKGMAIPGWNGYTLVQTGSYASDMQHYCNAADLVSADFYGWTDPWEGASVQGAWGYGRAIDNMRLYCAPGKPVWGFVETGMPWDNSPNRITPAQLESAVWNILVHGGNGVIYFAHNFWGGMVEDGLLADATMTAKVKAVNARILSYAPILNSFTQSGVTATGTNSVPVTTLFKKYAGASYVFAQADGKAGLPLSGATTATITISGVSSGTATVLDENRTVPIVGGQIIDTFAAYGVHIYKL
jgi:hypothetical protein